MILGQIVFAHRGEPRGGPVEGGLAFGADIAGFVAGGKTDGGRAGEDASFMVERLFLIASIIFFIVS